MALALDVLEAITDWRKAPNSYIGYSSIQFRNGSASSRPSDGAGPFYILGGGGDSWFRSTEGNSKGYGLAIVDFKVTSRTPMDWGDFKAYKATMKYVPSSKEEEKDAVTDPVWLLVHNKVTLDEILRHISTNSKTWRA